MAEYCTPQTHLQLKVHKSDTLTYDFWADIGAEVIGIDANSSNFHLEILVVSCKLLSNFYTICEIDLYLQKIAISNDGRYFQNGGDFIKASLSFKVMNSAKKYTQDRKISIPF